MINEFSNGYYLSSYWVTKDTQSERMNSKEYNKLRNRLSYSKDIPLIMKLGDIHFEIIGDSNVPSKTIQLSSQITSNININRIPEIKPVLVVKPKFAKQLLKLSSTPLNSGMKYI